MEWVKLIGTLGTICAVFIAFWNYRKTQQRQQSAEVLTKYAERYEKVMSSFPPEAIIARLNSEGEPPKSTIELKLAVLRYLNLCSEEYFLWCKGFISKAVWEIWSRELVRMLKTPLYIREWKNLKHEFDSYPEFQAYVDGVQAQVKENGTLS